MVNYGLIYSTLEAREIKPLRSGHLDPKAAAVSRRRLFKA